MTSKTVSLTAILVLAIIAGLVDVYFADAQGLLKYAVVLGPRVITLAFIIIWVHGDSREHGYERSALLDVGIFLLTVVFIPVYLFKSREPGRRARAIGLFAVMCVACSLLYAAGGTLAHTIHPNLSLQGTRDKAARP